MFGIIYIIANTLDAATSKKFYIGLGKGALKKGQEYADAFANMDIMALLSALEKINFDNLDEKALGLAKGVIGGMEKQLYSTLQALANEDYEKAGELLSGLAIDVVIKIVAPAAGGALAVAKGSKALTKLLAVARRGTPSGLKKLPCCFVAGTPIKVEDGHKPIEQLQVGDQVVSKDIKTGKVSLQRVSDVHVRPISEIDTFYKLTVKYQAEQDVFYVTGEHPFWVSGIGKWVTVDQLTVGSKLVDHAGRELEVAGKEAVRQLQQTYNITVDGSHTYFAGKLEVLVHNCGEIVGRKGGRPIHRLAKKDGTAVLYIKADNDKFYPIKDIKQPIDATGKPIRNPNSKSGYMKVEDKKRIFEDHRTSRSVKGYIQQQLNRGVPWSKIEFPKNFDKGHYPHYPSKHNSKSRLEFPSDNRKRPSTTGNNEKWR